jgi:hypothetical protein
MKESNNLKKCSICLYAVRTSFVNIHRVNEKARCLFPDAGVAGEDNEATRSNNPKVIIVINL